MACGGLESKEVGEDGADHDDEEEDEDLDGGDDGMEGGATWHASPNFLLFIPLPWLPSLSSLAM